MSESLRRLRAVFDCNTFVQAIAFEDGPAGIALRHAEASRFELCVSRATMRELRRVLAYPEIRSIAPSITAQRGAAFMERILYRFTLVRRVPHTFTFSRDPNDEPYLDLAFAARADYLVSRDKDLLSLMTGHSAFCKYFRQKTHPLEIVTPTQFLRRIEIQ